MLLIEELNIFRSLSGGPVHQNLQRQKAQHARAVFGVGQHTQAHFKHLLQQIGLQHVVGRAFADQAALLHQQWQAQSLLLSMLTDRMAGKAWFDDAMVGKAKFSDKQFADAIAVIKKMTDAKLVSFVGNQRFSPLSRA